MDESEKQPEKTDEELREVARLLDSNAAYGDFPDGVTWADVDAALALKAGDE